MYFHVWLLYGCFLFFFFNDTATTEIYTLSLHDALPIWLRALAPEVPLRRRARHRHLHHLSGAADAAVHSARRHHPQLQARRFAVGADPHLSDVPHSVLHLALDGLLQGDPARTRGMRAHRRRLALEGDGLHHLPDRGARSEEHT